MNKNKLIFTIFILFIVGGASYFISKDAFTDSMPSNDHTQDQVLSESDNDTAPSSVKRVEGSDLAIEGEGDFEVNPIAIKEGLSAEEETLLNRVVSPSGSVDQNSASRALEEIGKLSASLRENPESVDNWLVLGVYRKMIGDYDGAINVWNYVSKISPDNYVSHNNLGELYAYYIKDNVKAEASYKKAIENGKNMMFIYRNFHDFYRHVLKDEAKAKALLEEGIAANPGSASQDLQNLLELYYK